tara:strand:- start:774 stop:2345 length:1572 start_codon:yes stop_codon:yes gene_type:complete
MNTPGDIKSSAYGVNGPMTETFHYKIDGKKIHETLDINMNSPTYGHTISVKTKVDGKLVEVSPNSELGKLIEADENGARQNSYLNEMQYIAGKAEKSGKGNAHNIALKNSNMYQIANGDKPYNVELPAVEYVIEPSEVESNQKDDDTTSDPIPRRSEEKKFVGVMQYPASAHYSSRGRPAQDHMKIDMFQYKAPQKEYLKGYFEDDNADAAAVDQAEQQRQQNSTFSNIVTQGLERGSNIKKYLGTVKMPIPNQLSTANGVSWGEGRANAFEAASFMGAFSGIRNLMSGDASIGDLISNAAGTVKNLGKDFLGGLAPDANTLLASAAARAALASININTDPNQFVTRATGKAINPNLELLFAGPKLRSFQFTFQFAPQNIEDAAVTRRIMRFFKQGMLPSRATSSDLFLVSPNIFRLAFMNGQDKIRSLNSFKLCALTTCQINFTPDGVYQAYDDPSVISQPVRSQMTLGFTELTPIFHDDYDFTEGARASILDLQRTVAEDGPLNQENFTDTTVQSSDDIGY